MDIINTSLRMMYVRFPQSFVPIGAKYIIRYELMKVKALWNMKRNQLLFVDYSSDYVFGSE